MNSYEDPSLSYECDREAEIERLRARLAEAERERNENALALARATRLADERYEYTCKVLAERNDATIRAELAEQDAARYRWLRAVPAGGDPAFVLAVKLPDHVGLVGDALDTEIDKRIADSADAPRWTQEQIDAVNRDAEMLLAKMQPGKIADDSAVVTTCDRCNGAGGARSYPDDSYWTCDKCGGSGTVTVSADSASAAVCNWRADAEWTWQSDCGQQFCLEDEPSPSKHGMKFCHGCGKPLAEHPYVEPPVCGECGEELEDGKCPDGCAETVDGSRDGR